MTRFNGATALILAIAALGFTGCTAGVKEELIEVKASNDPLHEPRQILARYAEGQAMGSEASMFADMVSNVRKIDPQRADVLEQGLADLQKASPAERPAKAKELLAKIQPQQMASP